MPDFTQLLKRPLNDVKRPDTLPQGTYHGVVLNYEIGESKEKKTPYVRFNCRITGPGDDVPIEMLQKSDGSGMIDLSNKKTHADFYLTDDSYYRIKEALDSMGIDTTDRDLSQTLPETLNQPVLLSITLKPSNRQVPGAPMEFFNNCDRMVGTAKSA